MTGKTFLVGRLGMEGLREIGSYARSRGVTINDVLLTAFCRSLFTVCDPPRGKGLMVEVPVNLRRHLPGEQTTICDLSAAYLLSIDRRDGESFDDTLRRVHQTVDRKKRNRTELAEMLLLELLLLPGPVFLRRIMSSMGSHSAHPTLSNLGSIDDEKVNFGSATVSDVQFIGPVLYPPSIGLGVFTFRGRMNISLSYVNSAANPASMERLLDLFVQELPGNPSFTMVLNFGGVEGAAMTPMG